MDELVSRLFVKSPILCYYVFILENAVACLTSQNTTDGSLYSVKIKEIIDNLSFLNAKTAERILQAIAPVIPDQHESHLMLILRKCLLSKQVPFI